MSSTALRRLIVIAVIVLWELLPRLGIIPELFLPSLSSTLAAGWTDAAEYGRALLVTLYEVAVAMVFACGGGILAGAIVGSLPRPRVLIMPMVSSLYAVPLVILYPVFTVWLGIGSESKIAFASIYGFLPTMLATAAGIQTIDPQLLLAARSMGATLGQLTHHAFGSVPSGIVVAAFMAAANVGVTKTLLGSTLVVTEMGGLRLLPTTLLAALVAQMLTSSVGLIESQRERTPMDPVDNDDVPDS